ncbi:MAG TPA: helix-turn-helix transcriptional regulator [Thermoanaerobaculia bacterium]|nr:helix-turn-helix transcriptional regulator [Thermoanaerobaculia bacterium]
MDLVLKLREIRRLRGLSQKDVARLSGVGEKTISSFETGQRIGSLKLEQLKRLLGVYGLTESDFFGSSVERQIAPWEIDEDECAAQRLLDELRSLPAPTQKAMVSKFQLMLEGATHVAQHTAPARERRTPAHPPTYDRHDPAWHEMAPRN